MHLVNSGIGLAESFAGAALRLSLMRSYEEAAVNMKRLLTFLIMAMIATGLAGGTFAQKGDDKRPPKDRPKVVERPKPPPSNNNSGSGNSNKRGKP